MTTPTKPIITHITKEGSRKHVLSWDSHGTHCSEPNCEINKRQDPCPGCGKEMILTADEATGTYLVYLCPNCKKECKR